MNGQKGQVGTTDTELYGVLAEFTDPNAIVAAARRAYALGYRDLDAFSPYPIEELSDAIGFHQTRVPLIVLCGGLFGGCGAYLMQWWISVVSYPLNVGGRPLHSGPSFIPVTFEMTVLFAAIFGLLGMLGLNRLPEPYHPVFNVPRFERATQDRFFLLIKASDPRFQHGLVTAFLQRVAQGEVSDVPR